MIGALDLRVEQKRAAVAALCNPGSAAAETTRLRRLFALERTKLLDNGLLAEDLPSLYKLRAAGKLPLPGLTPSEADIVCQTSRNPDTRAVIWRLVGAQEWVQFRDEAEATAWLEWARHHFPQASCAEWANLTSAFRLWGQLGAAGKAIERAFQCGESARAWEEYGLLLHDSPGKANEAEAAYRKATCLDPNDPAPWNNLAIVLAEELARPADAEIVYREAIEFHPNNYGLWNNLAGLLANKLGQADKAELAFRKAIELDPERALAWGNFGWLLESTARFEEAREAYAKAMALDHQNAGYWASRLQCLAVGSRWASIRKEVSLGDLAATRNALSELLSDHCSLPAILAGSGFVEGLLAPSLADEQKALAILGMLWGLGFAQYARPLLLAFEAAVTKNPESLDDLEPEVRNAAREMYQRLMAGRERTES